MPRAKPSGQKKVVKKASAAAAPGVKKSVVLPAVIQKLLAKPYKDTKQRTRWLLAYVHSCSWVMFEMQTDINVFGNGNMYAAMKSNRRLTEGCVYAVQLKFRKCMPNSDDDDMIFGDVINAKRIAEAKGFMKKVCDSYKTCKDSVSYTHLTLPTICSV